MKYLIMFFLLSNVAIASDVEVEFDSLVCQQKDMTCNQRDGLGTLLDMSAIMFRSISFICGFAPEPAVTKATAVVTNGLGIASAFASFMVKRMPCKQSGQYEPNLNDQRAFVEAVCVSLNKQYDSARNICVD